MNSTRIEVLGEIHLKFNLSNLVTLLFHSFHPVDVLEEYFYLCSGLLLLFFFMVYLWFVMEVGPAFMKKRKPFNIINLIRAYNIFQVLACFAFVIKGNQLGFEFKYLWKCEKFEWLSERTRLEVRIGFWLFLILRVIEFVETVFFILRKKYKQASFLHVFHHIGSALMTWLFIVADIGSWQAGSI